MTEQSPIDGTWTAVEAQLGGQAMNPEQLAAIVITLHDGRYKIGIDSGSFSLDSSAAPATIDIVGSEGPNAGKEIAAIYSLENDLLTICYDLSCSSRPAAFASSSGTLELLVRYRRV